MAIENQYILALTIEGRDDLDAVSKIDQIHTQFEAIFVVVDPTLELTKSEILSRFPNAKPKLTITITSTTAANGFLAGLAALRDIHQYGSKTLVLAKASAMPTSTALQQMEESLERWNREVAIVSGSYCVHTPPIPSQRTNGLLETKIVSCNACDPLENDNFVHLPCAELTMFDVEALPIWETDSSNSCLKLKPAQLAFGVLLAMRGVSIVDHQRSASPPTSLHNFGEILNYSAEPWSLFWIDALLFQRNVFAAEQTISTATKLIKTVEQNEPSNFENDKYFELLKSASHSGELLVDLSETQSTIADRIALNTKLLIELFQQKSNTLLHRNKNAIDGSIIASTRYEEELAAPQLDPISEKKSVKDKVTFSVASFDKRIESLEHTLNSIYDQADQIYVYLNNFETVPTYCKREKIKVFRGQDYCDLSANGKMFYLREKVEGYVFIIDDDNHLPPDYVQRLVNLIELYKRKVAVTVHGSNMVDGSNWYYQRWRIHPYQQALNLDKFVNLPGSGTFAYHTDTLSLEFEHFMPFVMVDLALAIACRNQRVPIVSARRQAKWLVHMKEVAGEGLWEDFVTKATVHSPAMIQNGPWSFSHSREYTMRVVDELFGDADTSKLVELGVDADYVVAARKGQVPKSWSNRSNAFDITTDRQIARTQNSLTQFVEYCLKTLDLQSPLADHLDVELNARLPNQSVENLFEHLVTDKNELELQRRKEAYSVELKDDKVGLALRDFVQLRTWQKCKLLVRAMWQHS